MKYSILILVCAAFFSTANAQDAPKKITTSAWDGAVIVGTFDKGEGGFANFGGPSIKYKSKAFSTALGMLPGLRIKEDKSTTYKSSIVTPSLGVGLTFAYKHIALQIPMYYNGKTNTADGKWLVGLGLGYKL